MTEDRISQLETENEELKARWPEHGVKPWMWQQLEDLEEELEKARKAAGGSGAR